MLELVTKDREKLRERLAAETEARKRLDAEKRELERKLGMGSAASHVETRKARDTVQQLARKKEELAEMRSMLQQQSIEIGNLTKAQQQKDRKLHELEKKMSQYDDSFYSLEARNVRDRTRMEEMSKAKARAEEERSVYREMLEQVHERGLKDRQELRRDAQSKLETVSARARARKARILLLEKELRERSQVEEEKNAYREQCSALMEQCSSLMEQLRQAHGIEPELPPVEQPAPRAAAAGSKLNSPPGFMERMRSNLRSSMSESSRGPSV